MLFVSSQACCQIFQEGLCSKEGRNSSFPIAFRRIKIPLRCFWHLHRLRGDEVQIVSESHSGRRLEVASTFLIVVIIAKPRTKTKLTQWKQRFKTFCRIYAPRRLPGVEIYASISRSNPFLGKGVALISNAIFELHTINIRSKLSVTYRKLLSKLTNEGYTRLFYFSPMGVHACTPSMENAFSMLTRSVGSKRALS